MGRRRESTCTKPFLPDAGTAPPPGSLDLVVCSGSHGSRSSWPDEIP